MAQYRIIRRPGIFDPTSAVYDVERRVWWWWWEDAGSCFLSLEAAKNRISELREAEANPIKREIVYEGSGEHTEQAQ